MDSALVAASEQKFLTPCFDTPEMSSVNSGWYDLVSPPVCQGSVALKDKLKKEWYCTGCRAPFRGRYEAQRHIDTAGMEVRCRYCDEVVNGAPFVLNRHVMESSRCEREWEERGLAGERTVDGAFRA